MKLLLSCISTKHSVLKQHWTETNQEIACPLTTLGSFQKPKQDLGGMLCFIEDMGCSQKMVELKMAAGMVTSDKGVFVTSFSGIHEVDPDSGNVQHNIVSSPLFNALHSISRTQRGYLVASTGLDLIVEFNRNGEILWQWWATDHGFTLTPTGLPRYIDKAAD
ncbi:MAG: hypothetical protein ACJ8AG_01605, partial [Ktedonobacteraceae bacterium]